MTQITHKQAHRRYFKIFVPTMALYVIGLTGGTFIWNLYDAPPLWLSVTATAAAVLPLLVFLYGWLRYTKEADEFHRQKLLWGFALAGCGTAAIMFAVGFAQTFDLIGHFDAYWYAALFIFLQGIATAIGTGKWLT
jgi:hypothetical protein